MLKSEFLAIAQANLLLHLLRILLLLRQRRRLLPPLPHRIQAQLLLRLLLQQQQRQAYHHLHHLRLHRAVLLKAMRVDLTILAPMACAAVSGVIVVQLTHTVENAAKAIAMGSLLHRLVRARPAQVLLQSILRHPLGSTMGPTTEMIVVSLHTLGIGKLVPPMSKLMLTRTL